MKSIECKRCGHINPKSANRCEHCYKKLDEEKAASAVVSSTSSSGSSKPALRKSPPPKISSPASSGSPSIFILSKSAKGSTRVPLPFTPSSIKFPGSSPKTLLPLPSHMLKYGIPHTEGFVRDLRVMTQDRQLKAGDFAGDALIALISTKFAAISAITRIFRREPQTAYKIQVEESSGRFRDVLIKDGKSIPPEIGEYVSVWGKSIKGVIHVQALFNHKTGAEI